MLKRRRTPPGIPVWYDNWPLAQLPDLVGSSAARRFDDSLRRFVNGQLSGRSFLIAGHRGAGKTTMVRHAVDRLTHEIFARLKTEATLGMVGDSLASVPQRPLLVRVHGPSLILDELPGPGAGEGGKPRQDADKTNKTAVVADGAAADRDIDESQATPDTAPPPKQSILVQLTTALYRALARECAEAFAIHARSIGGSDAAEVAAQLQLALDEAPDPALLRAFWQKFDALDRGVFFPRAVGRALAGAGLAGQGLREIVAVATAAQIFEVSAGKVVFNRVKKDSSKVDQEAGKAGTEAWPEIFKKLFGFSAGAALGGGAAYGLDLGSTASLLAGLVGGLASGFTSSLTRTREDTLDYRVMLDRSAASLERDLPLAIERIRAAGLSPIFLIDELDKLDGGQDGIQTTMRELIFRMKQLTTDYGFFCFLVDRAYFDRVQAIVEREAYAIEHSFFSERLYVLPSPADLQDYVLGQFEANPPDASGRERKNSVIVAKHLVHQSKLNMLDLVRQLDAADDFEQDSSLGGVRYTLTAAIQIAVGQVLAEPELYARSAQDITFRQSLIDSLYIISRAWERDEPEVTLGDNDVAAHLLKRMYRTEETSTTSNPSDHRRDLETRIGKRDADLLTGAARKLAGLLCDFSNLQTKLMGEEADLAPALDEITVTATALLARSPEPADLAAPPVWHYTFQYDQFGRRISDQEGLPLEPDQLRLAVRAANPIGIFREPGFAAGIPLNALIEAGLWSAGLTSLIVTDSCERLIRAYRARTGYAGFASDKATLSRVKDLLDQNLQAIGSILYLVFALESDTLESGIDILHRIRVVIDIPAILTDSFFKSPAELIPVRNLSPGPSEPRPNRQHIDETPAIATEWLAKCKGEAYGLTPRQPDTAAIWSRRASRLILLFGLKTARPFPGPLDYDDLIVVARNVLPAPLMRRDLATPQSISAADWSLFALEALTTCTGPVVPSDPNSFSVPPWMSVPALSALGFGPTLLTAIAEQALEQIGTQNDATPPDALRLLNELPAMASPSASPGLLLILAEGASATDPRSRQPDHPPVFLVRENQISRYAPALDMLARLNALQGKINEFKE